MEHMNAAGDLKFYATTEEFVEALSKHLKISKVCDNEHLTDCWSSKVVRMASGSNYEVKNAKTGRELHTGNTTNNVGIVLADGSQMILTYNPNVGASAGDNIVASKKSLPVGFGKTKEFAYTTSVTSGIDYVLDVNGPAGPNAETTDDGEFNDIRSFRIASFSTATCQGFKINGVCVYVLGKNYTSFNCAQNRDSEYCVIYDFAFDYLAGAKKACDELGLKFPSRSVFIDIFDTNDSRLPESGTFATVLRNDGTIEYVTYNKNASSKYSGFWAYADNKYDVVCYR